MIVGDRIKQAREMRRLLQGQLAEKIGVKQPTVAKLENGSLKPSDQIIEAISLQTGFPVSFFKQEPGPEFPLGSLLFRAKASVTQIDRAEAHQYGRLIFEWIDKTSALQGLRKLPLRLPRLSGDAITAARITRSSLGLSPDTPIPHLTYAIEKSGVLVLALPKPLKGRDAFSVWAGRETLRPVIVVINGAPGDRLRFNLAHEIAHLVMHETIRGDISELESQANQFAAELLMPEAAMRQEIVAPVTLPTLSALKPRWGVSIQALIRRAYDLEIITPRQYKYLMHQLTERGWRLREPSNLDVPVEKPRALRQMAEMGYGNPINYEKLASDLKLPIKLVKETLAVHAGKTPLMGGGEMGGPSKLLQFDRSNGRF